MDHDYIMAALFHWMTEEVHRGEGTLTLCLTENGDVGVFREGQRICIGVGDTAEEALMDAMRNEDAKPKSEGA